MRIVAVSVRVGAVAGRRRLDVVGDPHAQVAAGLARLGLLGAERLVVEHRERLLERLERGDVVVLHAVGVRVRELVRRSRLRRRSSAGSMPIWRAAMSSSTSRASDSNCHGPRYGARPTVFV